MNPAPAVDDDWVEPQLDVTAGDDGDRNLSTILLISWWLCVACKSSIRGYQIGVFILLIHDSWLVKIQINNKIENKITAIYI